MTKADTIFKENITKIMEEGVWSEQARPKYKDGLDQPIPNASLESFGE